MSKAIELLMIDDNPSDILFSQKQLKEYKVWNRINVVKDELEALNFLHRQGDYGLVTVPDIILMCVRALWCHPDSLLMQIKNDPTLKHIPVVILTAIGDEESPSEDLPISLCVAKPLTVECLFGIVKHMNDFSLTIVKKKKKKTKHVPKYAELRPSVNDISHISDPRYVPISPDQLDHWDNEGGTTEYVNV